MSRAELILRYTLSHPHCDTTIVGTCNAAHLAENIAAVDITLSAGDVARIGAAVKPDAVSGTRYPEKQLGGLGI